MQLQQMLSEHLGAIDKLNSSLAPSGGNEGDDAAPLVLDTAVLQLRKLAEQSAQHLQGSIVRFDQKLQLYAVDPAVEGRIVCVSG